MKPVLLSFISLITSIVHAQSQPNTTALPAPTAQTQRVNNTSFVLNDIEYQNVRSVKVSPTNVTFKHKDGVATFAWSEIPDNLTTALNIRKPDTLGTSTHYFHTLTFPEKIGFALVALGLLISFVGGLSFLVRAWRISPLWFIAILLPAILTGLLFHHFVYPLLTALGFPPSHIAIPFLVSGMFTIFYGMLYSLILGYLAWQCLSTQGFIPLPLAIILLTVIPGIALQQRRKNTMARPLTMQTVGLIILLGGCFLLSKQLTIWNTTTFTPPAAEAQINATQ